MEVVEAFPRTISDEPPLYPQQYTSPMVFSAQECLSPVATSSITPAEAGRTASEGVAIVPPEINPVLELMRMSSR